MKLFFAGAEVASMRQFLVDMKLKRMMFSYYNMKQMSIPEVIRLFGTLKQDGVEIFVDSGAHTFQELKKNRQGLGNVDRFVEEYIRWLKMVEKYIDIYVELDIEDAIGLEKVVAYRQKMYDAGLKPMLVWHNMRGMDGWRKMCKDNDYVGMGDLKGTSVNEGKVQALLQVAKEYKTKVHGFGMTKVTLMFKLPFYSVDSTSWLMGGKYGSTDVLIGSQLRRYDKKEKRFARNILKTKALKLGIDWNGVERDDYKAINRLNLIAWKELSETLEKKPGYWQDKSEVIVRVKEGEDLIATTTNMSTLDTTPTSAQKERIDSSRDKEEVCKCDKPLRCGHDIINPNCMGCHKPISNKGIPNESVTKEVETPNKDPVPVSISTSDVKTYDNSKQGNIMEIRQDPKIEAKRKDAHQRVMKGNTFHFIDGKQSKRTPPTICNSDCFANERCKKKSFGNLCEVREELRGLTNAIDSRNPDTVIAYLNLLNHIDMERHWVNYSFEKDFGGMLDKNVTSLGTTITDRFKLLMELQSPSSSKGAVGITDSDVKIYNIDEQAMRTFAEALIESGTIKNIRPERAVPEAGKEDMEGNTAKG